jgi:hypothetical protein
VLPPDVELPEPVAPLDGAPDPVDDEPEPVVERSDGEREPGAPDDDDEPRLDESGDADGVPASSREHAVAPTTIIKAKNAVSVLVMMPHLLRQVLPPICQRRERRSGKSTQAVSGTRHDPPGALS